MSDLLERLKEIGYNTGELDAKTISRLIPECAAEIERLSAELESVKAESASAKERMWETGHENERLSAENERLRWERDQYKENARRASGLRDSENA